MAERAACAHQWLSTATGPARGIGEFCPAEGVLRRARFGACVPRLRAVFDPTSESKSGASRSDEVLGGAAELGFGAAGGGQ